MIDNIKYIKLMEYVESLELKPFNPYQKKMFFIYKYGYCQECASHNVYFANIDDYNHTAKVCMECGYVEYRINMHRTIKYLQDKGL